MSLTGSVAEWLKRHAGKRGARWFVFRWRHIFSFLIFRLIAAQSSVTPMQMKPSMTFIQRSWCKEINITLTNMAVVHMTTCKLESATRITTVLKYVIRLDLLNCPAKFRGDTMSRSREKWRMKLLFLVIFRIFPNWNCHFRSWSWKGGCDVVSLYVLQSYRSCTFWKHNREARRSFG